jgi:hypothetical protein
MDSMMATWSSSKAIADMRDKIAIYVYLWMSFVPPMKPSTCACPRVIEIKDIRLAYFHSRPFIVGAVKPGLSPRWKPFASAILSRPRV